MRQLTLATAGFGKHSKQTRRAAFLAEMEQVVPWRELCAVVEPHYPKPGNGRRPLGLERMLRLHLLQHWFNLSDPAAEEALYDSISMRQFVGIDHRAEFTPRHHTLHLGEKCRAARQLAVRFEVHRRQAQLPHF